MFVKKANLNPAFQHNEYVFRCNMHRLFGEGVKVFDENKNLVFYSEKQERDLRVCSDESKTTELLSIKTDRISDAGAKYIHHTIHDSVTNEVVGSIRRETLKWLLTSEWTFFSNNGQEVGKLNRSSSSTIWEIFLEFFLGSYIISDSDGEKIAEMKQRSIMFVLEYKMNIIENPLIDRRLLISMGILLTEIEVRM